MILQSGLTCLLGLCSHFEQKRGFFMQGCPQLAFAQAPILHQSTKATKAKLPSWVGQGRHWTPYLGSNSIQQLNYRKDWKLDECRGIIFFFCGLQLPASPSLNCRAIIEQLLFGAEKGNEEMASVRVCSLPSAECFSLAQQLCIFFGKRHLTGCRKWERKSP